MIISALLYHRLLRISNEMIYAKRLDIKGLQEYNQFYLK